MPEHIGGIACATTFWTSKGAPTSGTRSRRHPSRPPRPIAPSATRRKRKGSKLYARSSFVFELYQKSGIVS